MALPTPGVTPANWGAQLNAEIVTIDNEILAGSGSPEGVATATPGIAYRDTAATNGAILWVKASGTGNTGWKVVYGDTGWRDIGSLFTGGTTPDGTNMRIKRTHAGVFFSIIWQASTTGYRKILDVPTGFGGNPQQPFPVVNAGSSYLLTGATSGAEWWVSVTSGATYYVSGGSYAVDVAWPASLPGTAV